MEELEKIFSADAARLSERGRLLDICRVVVGLCAGVTVADNCSGGDLWEKVKDQIFIVGNQLLLEAGKRKYEPAV